MQRGMSVYWHVFMHTYICGFVLVTGARIMMLVFCMCFVLVLTIEYLRACIHMQISQ